MKDTEVNRIKTDLICRHSLAVCKLAAQHTVLTGIHGHNFDDTFKDVFSNTMLKEVGEIQDELSKLDTKTMYAIIKRFL